MAALNGLSVATLLVSQGWGLKSGSHDSKAGE